MTTSQMGGERLVLLPQSTQINNSSYSTIARGVGEILGGLAVFLFEPTRRPHGMDQVVGRMYSRQRRRQGTTIQAVCFYDFRGSGNF